MERNTSENRCKNLINDSENAKKFLQKNSFGFFTINVVQIFTVY